MERARPQVQRQSTTESIRSSQGTTFIEQDNVETQPFACPYAKYDPNRYSHINVHEQDYRNCSTGYYSSIARLKQHLYRVHDRSQRCCPRCWTCFPDDAKLTKHLEVRTCDTNPCPEEKMTTKQHEQVRERVQGKPVQSWFKIYEILFPEEDEPPNSPFAEWVVGEDLRDIFELVEKRLPVILFHAAARRQPTLQSQRPTKSTPFPTTAELVLQAISQVKKEFAATDERFGSVFADERVQVATRPVMMRQGSSQSHISRRMQSAALSDSSEESTRGGTATPRAQTLTNTARINSASSRATFGQITPAPTPAPTPTSMATYSQQYAQQIPQAMLNQVSSAPDRFPSIPPYTVAYTTQPFTAPITRTINVSAATAGSTVPTSDAEIMAQVLTSEEMYNINRMSWQH